MANRRNVQLDSPTFVAIVQSDTIDNPGGSLRGLDIFADGTVSVEDIDGTTVERIFNNVAPAFRWVAQIKRVNATATTITDLQMIGLH